MNKKQQFPILILLTALLALSCSSHDDVATNGEQEPFPVQIATAESGQSLSVGRMLYYGESLALTYLYSSSPYDIITGTSTDPFVRFGVKWESNDDIGIFYWEQTGERANPMLWKAVGMPVDIYAYAPFIEPAEGTSLNYTDLFFSVLSDQSDTLSILRSDLLGWQARSYTPTSGQQKLVIEFDHLLSELNIILKPGPGATVSDADLDNAEVIVNGVRSSVNFSILDFIPHLATEVFDEYHISILPHNETDSISHRYRCVLPPQSIEADVNFVSVKIGEKTYSYQPVAALEFKPDTSYRLTLEVGDTRLNLIAVKVEPWGDPVNMTDDELELR